MALTLTDVLGSRQYAKVGNRYMKVWNVTFDSSYATGGEDLTASDLGFADNARDLAVVASSPTVGVRFDAANQKLLAFWGDYPAASAGVLIQASNGANLSAVTATLIVLGRKPSQ